MILWMTVALADPIADAEVVEPAAEAEGAEVNEAADADTTEVEESPQTDEDSAEEGEGEADAPAGPTSPVTVVIRRPNEAGTCDWGSLTRSGYTVTHTSELPCPDPQVGWVWQSARDPGNPDKWSLGFTGEDLYVERPGRKTRTLQIPMNQTVMRIDSAYNRDIFVVTVGPDAFTIFALTDDPTELANGEALPLTADPMEVVDERIGRRMKMVRWSSHAPQTLVTRPPLSVDIEEGVMTVRAKRVGISAEIEPLLEGATWSYPAVREDEGFTTEVLGIGWNAAERTVILVDESGFRTLPIVGEGAVFVYQTDDVIWAREADTVRMWDLETGAKLHEIDNVVADHPHEIIDF